MKGKTLAVTEDAALALPACCLVCHPERARERKTENRKKEMRQNILFFLIEEGWEGWDIDKRCVSQLA